MPPAAPVAPMRALLEGKKAALEAEIKNRHRVARTTGTAANVTVLSATLRAVKRQLAAAGDGR